MPASFNSAGAWISDIHASTNGICRCSRTSASGTNMKTNQLNRRAFLRAGCAVAAPLLYGAPTHPNVVLLLTDDQGYGDLACHGNPVIRTPNMDSLHARSVRFTNFHVSPTCAPTRSALMTGRYTNAVGPWHTIGGRSLLAHDEVTMADCFRAAGYRTGIFGKWH